METVMVQFEQTGPPPSLEQVRDLLGLQPGEIDTQFGVIATDPEQGLYAVLIAAAARKRVESVLADRSHSSAEGIFSNPQIEPFGPPEGKRPS